MKIMTIFFVCSKKSIIESISEKLRASQMLFLYIKLMNLHGRDQIYNIDHLRWFTLDYVNVLPTNSTIIESTTRI